MIFSALGIVIAHSQMLPNTLNDSILLLLNEPIGEVAFDILGFLGNEGQNNIADLPGSGNCNGIFTFTDYGCNIFYDQGTYYLDTDSLPAIAETGIVNTVTSKEQNLTSLNLKGDKECPAAPAGDEPCIQIATYKDFRRDVQQSNSNERIVFCEFSVTKGEFDKPVLVSNVTDVKLICKTFSKCTINGKGSHLKINGSHAKATLQGFTLKDATKGSITIDVESEIHEQTICNCNFEV